MRKQKLYWLICIMWGVLSVHSQTNDKTRTFTYQNPISNGIDSNGLRDCQVLRDGDSWYMTGTAYPHWTEEAKKAPYKGVPLYKSSDLLNWTFVDYLVSPDTDYWYSERFWAPEIQLINGKYYCLFNCTNDALGYLALHAGYAVADKIEGPYRVVTKETPLVRGNDLTFYQDEDKTIWAFWRFDYGYGMGYAQVDLGKGVLCSEVREAIPAGKVDFLRDEQGEYLLKEHYDGSMVKQIAKCYEWDSAGIEGAYVIKHNNKYYLFYSSWTNGYDIGYAVADRMTGPWVKSEDNPIYGSSTRPEDLSKDEEMPYSAVGHNAIFKGPDGNYWLSCHGIIKGKKPFLVMDSISFDKNGKIHSKGPTSTIQTIPVPR